MGPREWAARSSTARQAIEPAHAYSPRHNATTSEINESVYLVSVSCKVGYPMDRPHHDLRREYTANSLSVLGAIIKQAVVDVSLQLPCAPSTFLLRRSTQVATFRSFLLEITRILLPTFWFIRLAHRAITCDLGILGRRMATLRPLFALHDQFVAGHANGSCPHAYLARLPVSRTRR